MSDANQHLEWVGEWIRPWRTCAHAAVDTGTRRSWCRHCDADLVWNSAEMVWQEPASAGAVPW